MLFIGILGSKNNNNFIPQIFIVEKNIFRFILKCLFSLTNNKKEMFIERLKNSYSNLCITAKTYRNIYFYCTKNKLDVNINGLYDVNI